MSNLNDSAFPWDETNEPLVSYSTGLTKHELATIIIAGSLAGNINYGLTNCYLIPDLAYDIAKAVLEKFENKDGSNIG